MLRAVLFDWGDTLMEFAGTSRSLVEAGHRAGLEALGRDGPPDADGSPRTSASATCRSSGRPGRSRRSSTRASSASCSGTSAIEVSDEELGRYLEAEHAAWEPARVLGATTHALLEALR